MQTRIILILKAGVDRMIGGGLGDGLQVVGGVTNAAFVVWEAEPEKQSEWSSIDSLLIDAANNKYLRDQLNTGSVAYLKWQHAVLRVQNSTNYL